MRLPTSRPGRGADPVSRFFNLQASSPLSMTSISSAHSCLALARALHMFEIPHPLYDIHLYTVGQHRIHARAEHVGIAIV